MPEIPDNPVARLQIDSLIPDGCNIGVVFRVLLVLNVVVFGACLLAAADWRAGVAAYVDATMLLESSALASLLLLCALRRVLVHRSAAFQRWLCWLLPAFVTAVMVQLLQSAGGWLGGLFGSLTTLHVFEGLFSGGLCGGLMQHYFELRTRAYSPALAEARLQALQARIRPHFLFNSLNAVLSLIRSEPKRAETTLEDLADLFRVLMRDARDIITLEDEVRLCRQYLAIEQVRLGERLHVVWDEARLGDEVMRRACVPALLLQPLLENAVHYGVEPAQQPATVMIRMARNFDRIDITITNPVFGPAASGAHMALDNLRERLALLYDVEANLSTERSHERFEVRLRFPYLQHAPRLDCEPEAEAAR